MISSCSQLVMVEIPQQVTVYQSSKRTIYGVATTTTTNQHLPGYSGTRSPLSLLPLLLTLLGTVLKI
ncbi:hypothetical protein DOY81_014695 [Sarcophaga bullata]|nr:hypothetical protein DOY81_014695 [Sarcophaga bullata]